MKDETAATFLTAGERLDEIGWNGLRLIQKPEDFCYGIDAVLLADFAATGGGRRESGTPAENLQNMGLLGNCAIADLGTGTGIIPLVLSRKMQNASYIFGVEMQEESYKRAVRNVEINHLEDRLKMVLGDVSDRDLSQKMKELLWERKKENSENVRNSGFDIVTTNPPYMEGSCGLTSGNTAKMMARHETTGTLEDFIRTGAELLRDKGDFYMVHRPSRLTDICCLSRKYNLEPKAVRFVSPSASEIPNIMLIHCVLFGGRELRMRKPLNVYDEKGQYTQEVKRIYDR